MTADCPERAYCGQGCSKSALRRINPEGSNRVGKIDEAVIDREHPGELLAQGANPQALAAMRARFAELHAAGLWRSRRNSILAEVEARA